MIRYFLVVMISLFMVSCYNEKAIVPIESPQLELFNFPQGNNPWDKDLEQIYKDYGVKVVYKDLLQSKFDQSWITSNSQTAISSTEPNEEQIKFYVSFLKEHVFKYLPKEIFNGCFPTYIYLGYDTHQVVRDTKEIPIRFFVGMPGYWSLCLEGKERWADKTVDQIKRPETELDFREARGRILQRIFALAILKGKIVPPIELSSIENGGLLDRKTPIRLLSSHTNVPMEEDITDPNNYNNANYNHKDLAINRGYPSGLKENYFKEIVTYDEDNMFHKKWFLVTTYLAGETPEKVFWGYINMVLRFNDEELSKGYINNNSIAKNWTVLPVHRSRHKLLFQLRDRVVEYMKDEYNIDLEAIYNGQ